MIIDSDISKLEMAKEFVKLNNNIIIVNESSHLDEDPWFCVANKSASKGYALEYLSKYLSIPIQNTIAIGNDYNDVSMFQIAGTSVAVENAHDDIKKMAKVITKTNDEDGVAEFLEDLYEKMK
jgi:hydroxymethylpyrimidine pyrophosphatase-like HAD family hydrolase